MLPSAPPTPEVPRTLRSARASVRGLILGWCLWLLGSWGVTLAIDSSVPAGRWMVFSVMMGLMAIWPAFRLSQANEPQVPGRLRLVLLDWLCMLAVFQTVVWPLRLLGAWSIRQACWLNGAVAAWSLLSGLLIAWGCGRSAGSGRTAAMVLCILLLVGEPAVMLLAGLGRPAGAGPGWTMRVSPVQTVWALTRPPSRFRLDPWTDHIKAAGLAAVAGWVVLGGAALIGRIRRPDRPEAAPGIG